MIEELVLKSRSVRRFYQDVPISQDTLTWLVNLARLTPSAANLQPLKYILSNEPVRNALIFPCLAWAGYLKDWPGPAEGERPSAYILVLGDTGISKNFWCDHGIVSQTMLLGAREQGFGGCIIASIKKDELRKALEIPEKYEILLALALGKPKEEIIIKEIDDGESIKYWRDERQVHYVPKRKLDDIIIMR
ncbi:MAG: nitroreductase family protein [Nitrospirae bacterium]|nr:nitroreductase family protein [Nitrospirota bacterium]